MRTTEPRRAFWIWAATGVAGAAACAACADALHLDPPGSTGGSSGSHSGSSSTGSGACQSNQDCPSATPVCDTVARVCHECLTVADCGAKPGTVCSKGVCGCPSSDPKVTLTYCAGEAPKCVDADSSPTDCGSCGHACFGNCAAGKCADKWEPTATAGAPEARSHHLAVWTGSQMFVWGGKAGTAYLDTGGLYDPVKRVWTPASQVNAPSPRSDATAVFDTVDNLVVVWGGQDGSGKLSTGGLYDPAKNTWKPMDTSGAPGGRVEHTAVWATQLTGFGTSTAGMIVWGGTSGAKTNDGAVFDPSLNKWVGSTDAAGAPTARGQHTAVWDAGGSRMVVFGGLGPPTNAALGDGGNLDAMGVWDLTTQPGAPTARFAHTAVYDNTSASTIVWGGSNAASSFLQDGAMLVGTSWMPLSNSPLVPEPRMNHTAVVVSAGTKSQMIIFGGEASGVFFATGWSLDIAGNLWSALPTAPSARTHHTAVATGTLTAPGSTMIVWGGDVAGGGVTNTGAIWDATP
jgi:hypothetical protein